MRLLAIVILPAILIGLSSCAQNSRTKKQSENIADDYKPVYTVTELNDQLEASFKQSSSDALGQIFKRWNETIQPNPKSFIEQNDTIKAIFDAYREFYKPLDLLKLGDWEWGNELNSKSKYVVVQNNISYAVMPADSIDNFDWGTLKKEAIDNFRPPVTIAPEKVLYLTTEYDKALNQFLGTESTKVGEPNVMNPSLPAGESEKRYEMIRPFIPVLHGHWGGYWHLETHPIVNTILFNKNLTTAKFYFRVGYQGGEATLIKSANRWTIKESNATWIE